MKRPSHHTIKTTFEQTGENDAVLCEIECVIRFQYRPPSGDGWNEPREDAYCEFDSLTHEPFADWYDSQMTKMAEDMLESWGEQWVDDHQAECMEIVQDADDAAQEQRADYLNELRRGM